MLLSLFTNCTLQFSRAFFRASNVLASCVALHVAPQPEFLRVIFPVINIRASYCLKDSRLDILIDPLATEKKAGGTCFAVVTGQMKKKNRTRNVALGAVCLLSQRIKSQFTVKLQINFEVKRRVKRARSLSPLQLQQSPLLSFFPQLFHFPFVCTRENLLLQFFYPPRYFTPRDHLKSHS